MGMVIDGPITSQVIDSSGETLHLKGLDIADFNDGKAFLNFEHDNDMAENILGKFISAKKIFKASDCDNDRQRLFWDQLKVPFLYGVCELFDDEGHPGAVAAAAILRYFKKRNEKVMVGFSIEGSTLERNGNDLLRTVGRRCAWTLKPANHSCWVDVLGESGIDVKKYESGFGEGVTVEVDTAILSDTGMDDEIKKALETLKKTLTAGVGNVAPSNLTGGAALSPEFIAKKKNKIKAIIRDWNRTRPLKEVIKAAMPEISDQYVDHFVDIAEDLALKKSGSTNLSRINAKHAIGDTDEDQRKLIEGLYWGQASSIKPDEDASSELHLLQNDSGGKVFLKKNHKDDHPTASRNAVAYYKLAKEAYNMAHHVPVAVMLSHPSVHNGVPVQAQQHLDEAISPLTHLKEWNDAVQKGKEDGSLHKLALMDLVNGEDDRHVGNVMVKDGRIYHVDNDRGFYRNEQGRDPSQPHYYGDSEAIKGIATDQPHIDAVKWLQSISPKNLATVAKKSGLDEQETRDLIARYQAVRIMAQKGFTFQDMLSNLRRQHD